MLPPKTEVGEAGGPVTQVVNHMGLRNLQERQKETGAVYKLLAVIESLDA